MGMFVPREEGGAGCGLHDYAGVAQALAAACMSTASIWTMHAFQVDALARFGTAELRRDLLPRIGAGKAYIASITTEPRSGADLFSAEAPLLAEGGGGAGGADPADAQFRREAPVVTGARHADGFLVTLRAGPDAGPHEVTLVYADRHQVELVERAGWDTMGVRGSESVAVGLSGAVPPHNVVGEPGGFRTVASESMVPLAHIGWAACWLGAARGAFTELLGWMRAPAAPPGPTCAPTWSASSSAASGSTSSWSAPTSARPATRSPAPGRRASRWPPRACRCASTRSSWPPPS